MLLFSDYSHARIPLSNLLNIDHCWTNILTPSSIYRTHTHTHTFQTLINLDSIKSSGGASIITPVCLCVSELLCPQANSFTAQKKRIISFKATHSSDFTLTCSNCTALHHSPCYLLELLLQISLMGR